MKFGTRLMVFTLSLSSFSFGQSLSREFGVSRLRDLEDVAARLEGTIDSSRQSMLDRDYVDVRVTQCQITINDAPGYLKPSKFLYVEQALSLSLDAPYRQRVIKLSLDSMNRRGVVSSIYEINLSPDQVLHLCSKDAADRVMKWSDLKDVHCSVYMHKIHDLWVGETQSGKCPNDYGDAKFASSIVRLSRTGMYSWDRGWDAEGNQVWGAVKGGYNFEKMSPATTDVDLNAVVTRYTGKMNTFKQSAKAPDAFQPIQYNNCLIDVPMISQRPGKTILIDQSAETPTFKFTRTKFLRVERNDKNELIGTYLSLRDSSQFRGMCDKPLEMRTGRSEDVLSPECRISFTRDGRDFVGKTPAEGCASNFRGAVKLTVEARLTRSSIQVLERWYDRDGKQVAGSTQGPYIYELED